MKLFGIQVGRETRASIESERVPVSAENFMAFFGLGTPDLPAVTVDIAMQVPAVQAAVLFLSRTLATMPLEVFRRTDEGSVRVTGKIQAVLEENPNEEMDSFKFRRYFWEQVFTGGRGLAFIEKKGSSIEAIWPMDPARATVRRQDMRLIYSFEGRDYAASEVLDVPFMLRSNLVQHRSPLTMAAKAIQLAIAMNDYASTFFAGGGVPPMSLEGPMAANGETMRRMMADVATAMRVAKEDKRPVFQIPPGYKMNPVGFDPEKGQMTDARVFQIQEIARAYQMPPNFLQDLSRATFSNVEQNDLYLVKHLISQWCAAFEGEMNLKLFGRLNGKRYVRHNLDGLMRGDFQSRIEGLARGVQTALITPNEARQLEGRPRHSNPAADQLLVQGATVPLGTEGQTPTPSKQGGNVAAEN